MNEPPYITCRELIEFIVDYRDGTLPKDRTHEVERHLAVCPSCVEYLAGYERTVALTKLARDAAPVPAEVPAALIAAILAARRR